MNKLIKALLVCGAASMLSQPLFAQNVNASGNLRQGEAGRGLGGNVEFESPVSRPFLQGTWQGVLTAVGLEGDPVPGVFPPLPEDPGRQLGFKLEIRQDNAVFYLQNGQDWIPIGEGQDMRLNDRGRSSVIITALPGGPSGTAIEVWLINVMRWEEDTVMVHLSRTAGPDEEAGAAPSALNLMGLLDRAG